MASSPGTSPIWFHCRVHVPSFHRSVKSSIRRTHKICFYVWFLNIRCGVGVEVYDNYLNELVSRGKCDVVVQLSSQALTVCLSEGLLGRTRIRPTSIGIASSNAMSISSKSPQEGLPFSRPGSPMPHRTIGWIGLGSMGYFMARNLAKHTEGHTFVYNRTREKSEKLQEELGPHKIKIMDTFSELVIMSDVVFTNLANDEVVSSVYDGIVHTLKVGMSLLSTLQFVFLGY